MFALPCLVRKSGWATSSATVSSSPCGIGTGGDRGGGVLGLLRLEAGGVAGWCGDLRRPGGCRVGLCRHDFLWGRGNCAERARFRCAGTGVYTLWCPLWQQWRTPLCLRVHLGHGGKLCNGHSCSWGLRATCSSAWWPSLCVCVCVICTFRGGSLCSVGLDASFGSGLLRPLCDVVSLPSAESEPLYFAG